jgi:hypothetical protein
VPRSSLNEKPMTSRFVFLPIATRRVSPETSIQRRPSQLPKLYNPFRYIKFGSAMIGKPFKPPLFLRRPSEHSDNAIASNGSAEPPAKKRRISSDSDHGATATAAANFAAVSKPIKSVKTFLAHRKPLGVVANVAAVERGKNAGNSAIEGYYTVLWFVNSS